MAEAMGFLAVDIMNKNVDKTALTWEDIAVIHAHLEDVFTETAAGEHEEWTIEDIYKEVLLRYEKNKKICAL